MSKAQGIAQSANQGQFKNRIINGAMMIDQRNDGASVTPNNSYTVDRWECSNSQTSKFTAQQNAGSVTPPTGFSNYLGITSSSAYSVTSSDYFFISQKVEGFNTADFMWGTANAQTVTLSFWVRSSLTGTFGGAVINSAQTYGYPFTYTISSANTWEQKSVTIVGPTAGTWIGATNGKGLQLLFGLGTGSNSSSTAGSWQTNANGIYGATGATSVVGTSGATFYITGVQLEKGSTVTSFDYRPYTTELQLCQRYYWFNPLTYFSSATALQISFKVTMRAAPTVASSHSGGFIGSITTDGFSGYSSSNQTTLATATAEL